MFLAIVGLGNVGRSVVRLLRENRDLIRERAGVDLIPKIGIAKCVEDKGNMGITLSTQIDDVFNDDEIDIVVELIGGVDSAYELAVRALHANKSFVTANKAMLAHHRYDLEATSRRLGKAVGFEASVCGGIPIIGALRDGLCANHILSIKGIMNGTSNFILSKMSADGMDFSCALRISQELGYAELDPHMDISGIDCAHKLVILCSLAYGVNVKLSDIIVQGIEGIRQEDIAFAKSCGYEVKLLGIAKKLGNTLEARVHMCLVDMHSMIAGVSGAMNAVYVHGDFVGESFYYGAGAGGDETASSVISDIIAIARGRSFPMLGYRGLSQSLVLKHVSDLRFKYYLRFSVVDKVGVLSVVSNVLNRFNITIRSLLQKECNQGRVLLLLTTYMSREVDVTAALEELKSMQDVLEEPFIIRIED